MSDFMNELLHMDGAFRRLMTLSLVVAFTGVFASCERVDKPIDDADPDVTENPDDNTDVPVTPDTKTVLFFDVDGTSEIPSDVEARKNIEVSALADVNGGYQLTFTAGDEHSVVTEPLEKDLAQRNVKLTFLYQCDAEITRIELQYLNPVAGEKVYKGALASSSNVDVDEDGYASAGFVLTRDLETFSWGNKGNMIRLYLEPASAAAVLKIKDIVLEETAEDPDPVEEPDLNKFPLTFTPDRGAHWEMENAYGIYSGISFTRNGDEYSLLIDDSYSVTGVSYEHYIATDPLTRSLIVGENQVVELIFKYKASTDFILATGLYPFNDPGADWPASFTESTIKASNSNSPDKDGWATFTHNLSRSITTKTPQWGMNVDGNDQQIRFTVRGTEGDQAHPEQSGLDKLELKDVHLYVREMGEDEKPVEGEVKLALEAAAYQLEKGITAWNENNGEYDITFSGNFAGLDGGEYTEYEVYTKELEADLLAGVTYNLEFEYQIPITLDDFRVMYFNKNGGGDNTWEDALNKTMEASESTWKKYSSALSSRAAHNNWGGKGQVLRIHFGGSINQNVGAEWFGKPLNVKVKNVKLVPAE